MRKRGHVIVLVGDAGDSVHQRRQCLGGVTSDLSGSGHFVGCMVHRQHGGSDVIAYALDRRRNALGRLRTFHGQRPDFVGHDGKSQSFIAGA